MSLYKDTYTMENKLFLISGSSGVGKTTITQKLLEQMPKLERLITYVTRQPRPDEINGRDYNFISEKKFKQKIKKHEFLEFDQHYGNYYGNSKKDLEDIWNQGKTALILLDINGVRTIKKLFPQAKSIFILPDNLENLKKRIRQRPMSDQAFEKRWKQVKQELKLADEYDFQIKNKQGQMDQAVEQLRKIIENTKKT